MEVAANVAPSVPVRVPDSEDSKRLADAEKKLAVISATREFARDYLAAAAAKLPTPKTFQEKIKHCLSLKAACSWEALEQAYTEYCQSLGIDNPGRLGIYESAAPSDLLNRMNEALGEEYNAEADAAAEEAEGDEEGEEDTADYAEPSNEDANAIIDDGMTAYVESQGTKEPISNVAGLHKAVEDIATAHGFPELDDKYPDAWAFIIGTLQDELEIRE